MNKYLDDAKIRIRSREDPFEIIADLCKEMKKMKKVITKYQRKYGYLK